MPKGHYLPEAVNDAIWVLRAEGVSDAEIARRLVMPKRTVSKYLERMGGIRPRPRHRAERCLTLAEREEISRGIAGGESARATGRRLGRSQGKETNGLLRQYFPRGKSLAGVTQAELDDVARKLTTDPARHSTSGPPPEKRAELIDGPHHTGASER